MIDSEKERIVFEDIAEAVPAGTQHLMLEVFAAASGDGPWATVQLGFNHDAGPDYIGRLLLAEGDSVTTKMLDMSSSAEALDIPGRASGGSGGGQLLIPWAFLADQKKHFLAHSAVGGTRYAMRMGHWASVAPISSIHLQLEQGMAFAPGSRFRLYAVDEQYNFRQEILQEDGDFRFNDIPAADGHLIVIGQTRSRQNLPTRRGDRVWYAINGDEHQANYQMQRITGEAKMYREGRETPPNNLEGSRMTERRVGWNSAEAAPPGVFGPWIVLFPEYANPGFWRTFMSRHGTYDAHYDPVANEIGRWASSSSIESLRFHPQAARGFKAGSRIGLYHSRPARERHVVAGSGQDEVVLRVPASEGTLHALVLARSTLGDANEDRMLIEINGDREPGSYSRQYAGAIDGRREAQHARDNEIGIVPAGNAPKDLMSSTHLTFMGSQDLDLETQILSYGGVPGDGRIALYGTSWKRDGSIRTLTFRTKSGEPIAPGSIFTIWVEDNSVAGVHADRRPMIRWLLGLAGIAILALAGGWFVHRAQRRDKA